ncbi:peptidyl-prolyl cis-trans isomerase SurA [Flaviramulus basaltis]|uniref:Peptidyl-prolyl cis-trans isomerase SurA n=1 Tax=Flaviramulus basaltis TaxID=369401 RepID=A0A1K2II62_9FLAO|nr:peptidylprolyl isomerase [Flaviramulus basaltis]SFZ92113.1 peptidyl-prolyl cis-trans isomerase SurA [Flaviramulus basaltis]
MKLRTFLSLFFIIFFLKVNAQSNSKEVLFTVGDEPVYTSEFLRVYNKNLDLVQDESQKDVDEYLKLFTNYKLKLKEAEALGLNKKPSYLRELSNYKTQLAKSFMKDSKVTDALVEEAYERISYDVNANHILVKLPSNANPKDTLVAYNNIMKLRERALKEGFEKVRAEVHNGQTIYGEKLGYFSGFKMVYNFETAAFNTAIGDISQPFRTQFGYHIVNVLDKRKSRGERTVAHIMLVDKKGDTTYNPEVRIQEIYKKINQGEDFESLAKQFSDDKSSASKGGMLSPFSGGQLSAQEFEDVAFGLKNIGDVSEPFKTNYGWHIVKLYDKKPIPEFEAIKSELIEKVKRDDRSKLIDEALVNKLKKHYDIIDNQTALSYFESILNDDYFKRTWQLPTNFAADKPLVKIGNKQFSYTDFGDYLIKTQRNPTQKAPYESIISDKYESFLNDNLIKYHEDNLEDENEEFAYIVDEYRDGLLLFELMETTIWNAAKTDSIGIQEYYKNNKENYVFPKRVDAVVASSQKQKTLKKVSKLLEKNMALDQIKSLVNSNDKIDVIFTSGIIDEEHQTLPKNFDFKKGISKIYKHNNAFVVVQVKNVLPETQKTFDEAKGSVISDYQNFKEENWIKELSEKYKVVVNQEALQNVKAQIKNQ